MNRIKIDLERVTSDIDRNIFGGYFEIGYPDIDLYCGMYSPDSPLADKDGLRSDVRAALERLNFSNGRFPGGNFASGYRWRDGIGPRKNRPVRRDLAWGHIMPNEFGTDEFINFCRKTHIEPCLCVNCGDGDMREAADWVEYCNGKGETALAKLRRENGFPEPHKVKYWGVGNEVDGAWQIGYKTPQEYARALTEFSKVMKWTDPDIKLIASAVCFWEDNPFQGKYHTQKSEWVERAQLMLEQAGNNIDYLAIHRYAHPYDDDIFEDIMAFAQSYDEHLNAYEGLMHAVSLERGIKHNIGIAVDEWGIIRHPRNKKEDTLETPLRFDNLEDMLITALHLNAFIRHAAAVRMANFTPTAESMGIKNQIRTDGPVLPQANFFPFELYSRTCGQQALDVFWSGDTFSGTYKEHTYSGIRTLDVAATLDESLKQLVAYVVNQSKDQAMETAINLTSGQFTGNVQVSVINGPEIKAANTDEKPDQVGVRKAVIKASGNSFNYTFEPHSVTALVCAVS